MFTYADFFEVMRYFEKQHSPIDRTWIDSWGPGLISIIWKNDSSIEKMLRRKIPDEINQYNCTLLHICLGTSLLCICVTFHSEDIFYVIMIRTCDESIQWLFTIQWCFFFIHEMSLLFLLLWLIWLPGHVQFDVCNLSSIIRLSNISCIFWIMWTDDIQSNL